MTHPGPTAAAVAERPRALRTGDDRIISGVCGGLGTWLGVDAAVMRLFFAWGSAFGGLGLLAYAALAVALPAAPRTQTISSRRRFTKQLTLGAQFAVVAGLLSALGLAPPLGFMLVAALTCIGGGLLWRAAVGRGEERETPRGSLSAGARVVAGMVLLLAGAVLSLRPNGVGSLGAALVAAAVVAGGAAVLGGPSIRRARREAQHERTERIRSEERTAVAARLHDSVLQTFAVIQRLDDASPRVQGIARSQERELRAWLYGGEQPDGPQTLASALRHATEEIELLHGVAVDLVQPADAAIDADVVALVQAAREAIVNAAHHSGVTEVSVLARVTPQEISIYVRDRGQGFNPDDIPNDRRGVRDSIVGRMQRHGGSATVTSAPGAGTEVELRLPRRAGGSPA